MASRDSLPGAGLPAFEAFYLNVFFKIGCAFTSDVSALSQFQDTTRDILRIIDENDFGILSQQMNIPRLQGIEESSRNWSVFMVLDHLNHVNESVVEIIRSLRSNSNPFREIRIEDFKPDEDVGVEVIDAFRDGNKRYWAFVKSHAPLKSSITHPHPWFGELDGHAWHSLATVHQKIHLRQIYKILAMIGVA